MRRARAAGSAAERVPPPLSPAISPNTLHSFHLYNTVDLLPDMDFYVQIK